MKMNPYLLSVTFVILSSSLLKLSYSNPLSVRVTNFYRHGLIASISCISNDGRLLELVNQAMSIQTKYVEWSVTRHLTADQICTMNDEHGNGVFVLTAFSGSWKLDEIIWKTHTYDDFIFDPIKQTRSYYWGVSEQGVYLYNFLTRKNELVMPATYRSGILAEIFVSNLFVDQRKMSLICVPEQPMSEDHPMLVNERGIPYKDAASWSIRTTEFVAGKLHTCCVSWTCRTPHPIQESSSRSFFTAFDSSWKLDEILWEGYTRLDFTYNPHSRQIQYLWGISERGLSLYNFKAKQYQVVGAI